MRGAKGGMLHPFLGRHCPFLAMPHAFLAMLHAFAATRSEGEGCPFAAEDATHEESRGPHALHWVPGPFRGRGGECVESSSERETTRSAYVAMPREPLETPNEDIRPSVPPGSGRAKAST
jgi:hypothetical protein